MGITFFYEISCEVCRQGDHPPGSNIRDVNRCAKEYGWLIKGKKYYCCKECYMKGENCGEKI